MSTPNAMSITEQVYDATKTPYPSYFLSASLLSTTLLARPAVPIPVTSNGVNNGIGGNAASRVIYRPPVLSRANCLTFGAAFALGGWIIQDGDLYNGSGFNFAWSVLYLIVNGRKSIKGAIAFRNISLWPVFLTGLVGVNAFCSGRRFIWGDGKLKNDLQSTI